MEEIERKLIESELPDIQNSKSKFEKRIKKVGVRNCIVPIQILGAKGRRINTVSNVSIYTSLTEKNRGAHMSRYLELLHKVIRKEISINILITMLKELKEKLESDDSYIKMSFTYFKKKKSPLSKRVGFVPYDVIFEGTQTNHEVKIYLTVNVPYTSLCPCSKEISKYGAHNQRSLAEIKVQLAQTTLNNSIRIEELIDLVEHNASSEVYSVLKRNDEKFVTEHAYENPMFVEDMSRALSSKLDALLDDTIKDYYVVVKHYESIHSHDAVSVITAGRELQ